MTSLKISTDALTSLHEWLNSEDALPALKSVAKSVISWAKNDSRIYEILCIEKGESTPELGVIAFVLEFLCDEKRLSSCRLQLAEHIDNGNINGLRAIIISRVINHCRDERRKEINSPLHFHYRRMSSTLSADRDTRYVYRADTGAYYAVSKSMNLPLQEEGFLGADEYQGWPEPGFPMEDLKKSKVRIAISRTFWTRALAELRCEHFLPIFDLVRYMAKFYNFSPIISSERHETIGLDGEKLPSSDEQLHSWQPHDALNTLASQEPVAEQLLLDGALADAAIRLIESWKPIVRICFFHYHVNELTLAETAARTGLNSPQSVSYHVEKANSILLEFFRQWNIAGYEGETPSDEEKKMVFRALIDFILKNHPECRDED